MRVIEKFKIFLNEENNTKVECIGGEACSGMSFQKTSKTKEIFNQRIQVSKWFTGLKMGQTSVLISLKNTRTIE